MRLQDLNVDFMSKINLPTLMVLGGRDQVGCLKSQKDVFQSINSPEKNFVSYDDCDHYILADGEWVDAVVKAAAGWNNSIN